MSYLRLAGILLVLVGAGLVAYNAPTIFLVLGAVASGRELEWSMWESARQGFTIGAVLVLGGVFLIRWK